MFIKVYAVYSDGVVKMRPDQCIKQENDVFLFYRLMFFLMNIILLPLLVAVKSLKGL